MRYDYELGFDSCTRECDRGETICTSTLSTIKTFKKTLQSFDSRLLQCLATEEIGAKTTCRVFTGIAFVFRWLSVIIDDFCCCFCSVLIDYCCCTT